MSIIDSAVGWMANRYHFARGAFDSKYRTRRVAPPYMSAELEQVFGTRLRDLVQKYSYKQLQQAAYAIPWIMSNITRIQREVSSAELSVVKKGSKEQDINHDFEELMRKPNPFFSGNLLLQYTVQALMFDREGAYWYLAPDSRNLTQLREIWPIEIGKIKPVRHGEKFISHYEYDIGGGRKPFKINPRNICRFILPDSRDLWKSLTPLTAASRSIETYAGITGSQVSLFAEGRGIPLAIVGLDPDINNEDAEIVRARIKEDWESGNRIAVVRSGDVDIETIGISNRDLEVIASQQFNRDEIDSIYMGFPWRSEEYSSAEGRKEANREIREQVIYPLHQMFAGQIQLQVIERFYSEQDLVMFEDVRRGDLSLQIQKHNVDWRAMTFDEARRDLNKSGFEHELLPGLGDLPFALATNSAFISSLYGLSMPQQTQPNPDGVGNLPESMSPEMQMNMELQQATGEPQRSINIDAALEMAIQEELKKYRTVTKRVVSRKGKEAHEVQFDTEVIPEEIMKKINKDLQGLTDEDEIDEVFAEYIS